MITLEIWDTGGQAEFDTIRPLSYNGADAIIICFALADTQNPKQARTSLNNACGRWLKEIDAMGPRNCAKILCGTKRDLRSEAEVDHV